MRILSRAALMLLLVVGACLSIGCSEETTGPSGGSSPEPPPGEHLWSVRFGDANSQTGRAAAIDASGNIFLTGCFEGTVDFGGGALTSAGLNDFFLAKFEPDGTHIWSKRFGDGDDQHIYIDVAVDGSGNVILAGQFSGTVDFGGGALVSEGSSNIFVAKLSSDGTHIWSKRFGSEAWENTYCVAADGSGNVIIAGVFSNQINFGGSTLLTDGLTDIFVAKFGPDGTHIWSKRFGNPLYQYATDIAADASGNIIVAGEFEGAVDFGGGTLASAGGWDIYVVKFKHDGVHLWSKSFGDGSDQLWSRVAVNNGGNVAVAGRFEGTIDCGGGTLTSAGGADIFVAQFGSDGTHLWSKRFGDGYFQEPPAVAIDASGNVIVTAYFSGSIDFGGGTFTNTNGATEDGAIAKFEPAGTHLWSKQFGSEGVVHAAGVSVDISGNVIVAGLFGGAIDFGGGELTSAGYTDIFIAKYGP